MRAFILYLVFTVAATAQDLSIPSDLTAGADLTLKSPGDGTLYLTGPGTAVKRDLKSGEDLTIAGEHLRHSGMYFVVVTKGSSVRSQKFFVAPAAAADISFLARPSRVPVSAPDAIRGTAFVFDQYANLVTTPTPVKFDLSVQGGGQFSQTVTTRDGVAWVKTSSGRTQGAAQFVATAGSASVRRVVQQTAAEPCNLRMRAQAQGKELLVETDPIRDCSGNPVPDGTIVTFIQSGRNGRSTVDARVKRGVAKATLPSVPGATLSVASGVVLGNEIRWGGGL